MSSVTPLLAPKVTEASVQPSNSVVEPTLLPHLPLVRSLATHLPPYEEVWDPSFRPEPSWQYQNLETLLADRNRELQSAAVDGWVLQTTISLTSPIDGAVTIMDTLWRAPDRPPVPPTV
ncbi:hypothetical protein ACFVU2_19750 [Leifsonia sp. NPDC058194]|uniref:hypothetical protein n=1 Tax=Leifsonia sp. NPDC058194 TaxID=3346374 RepID=UPI0036DACA9A